MLFCFACPEITVIEDLFFLEREIRGRGGNVGLYGLLEGEMKFLSHQNSVFSLVFLVVGEGHSTAPKSPSD